MRVSAATLSRLARLEEFRDSRPFPSVDPASLARYDWGRHARPAQLPPIGDWTYWLILTGRGWGKTRTSSEWVRQQARTHRYVNLIGATMDDAVSIQIEGQSGILEVCPDHERPRYIMNKRLLRWPNGAKSLVFSADEPDRLRGKQHEVLACDELASWRYPESWDQAQFGLRLGSRPRCLVTTTPRPRKFLKELMAHPDCVTVRGITEDNRENLASSFYSSIIAKYQGTRLGRQELGGELIEVTEGAVFPTFSMDRHVQPIAIVPGLPMYISVDAGTSRVTAATYFQAEKPSADRVRFLVHDSFLASDTYSAAAAEAIRKQFDERFPGMELMAVFIDGASSAQTSIGPSSLSEYERVFGSRKMIPIWRRSVADSLNAIEGLLARTDLVMHPRAATLIEGFQNYQWQCVRGEFKDVPCLDHPYADEIDSLAYGVLGIQPEGRKINPIESLPRVHPSRIM